MPTCLRAVSLSSLTNVEISTLIFGPLYQIRPLILARDSSLPFSNDPATNGGSSSNTFCIPSVMVVLFSHHFQSLQPYSAVDTGTTFFSLPSFIFTFLPPSLAKPGTSAGAGGGRSNE